MSLREIRLCDVATGRTDGGAKREICQGHYVATCPLCDVDCCKEHFNGGNSCYVSVAFSIYANNNNFVLGSQRVDVCKGCSERLIKLQQALNATAREIPLIEPVRGILTAQALAQEKK